MGECNQVISKALLCPPSSPSSKKRWSVKSKSSSKDHYFEAGPHTPEVVRGKKRPTPSPSPSDISQHEPATQRRRTDNLEGGSNSGVTMDDLVVKVEEMVKMLRRVGGNNNKDLVSDPLLACFVSAQTVLMACTAELMSRSTKKASVDKRIKGTNGEKKMNKSVTKN